MLVLNVIVCLLIIWYMPALLPVYLRDLLSKFTITKGSDNNELPDAVYVNLCYAANSPRKSYARALESEDNAGQDYRDLLESLYASLLRNSSSISSKGGKINADSFLSQNTDLMTEGSGRLAEHLRHVGAVDEEDLVVAIDHGDHVRVQDIWRSALAGQRSVCFWCRVSLIASESNKTDELARLVLDLEDYDVPRTGSKEEYPNLTIGIGDSTDLFVLTPTMPGTDMSLELVAMPKEGGTYKVAADGGIEKISADALSLFEKCRIVRQLSRRCDLAARRSVLEDHYEGLCSLVDGFYRLMEFDSCLETTPTESSAQNSDVFKRYVEENISVFTLRRSL